jgi:hypothetical protein
MPGYDHDNQPLPEWATTWFDCWERGEDTTTVFGRARFHSAPLNALNKKRHPAPRGCA